mmetsp:Transcript_23536/g.36294  ORF Transcript_23536/g.36294 Transcript_23536/m.36294 type:complete len:320 (-) Transcript_23536:64-1023(-)
MTNIQYCAFIAASALLMIAPSQSFTPINVSSSHKRNAFVNSSYMPMNSPRVVCRLDMSETTPETVQPQSIKESDVLVNEAINASIELKGYINIFIMIGIAAAAFSHLETIDQGYMRGWTPSEMIVRIPVDAWNGYNQILHSAPVATKAVTSASVYAIGDIMAQKSEGKSVDEIDQMRTFRSLIAGLIGHGPLSHLWYNISESCFTDVLHWTQWWSFLPKILVDQTVWGPIWNNTYILLLGMMQLRPVKDITREMRETTMPLILSGLKLWPLAHCVTYGLIPVENRLLWVDLVEIIWVSILASTAAKASGEIENKTEATR